MGTVDDSVKKAVYAYSNLNTFGVIASILENGHLSGPQSQSAERILAICQKEMQRQLKLYDAALDQIEKARGRG